MSSPCKREHSEGDLTAVQGLVKEQIRGRKRLVKRGWCEVATVARPARRVRGTKRNERRLLCILKPTYKRKHGAGNDRWRSSAAVFSWLWSASWGPLLSMQPTGPIATPRARWTWGRP